MKDRPEMGMIRHEEGGTTIFMPVWVFLIWLGVILMFEISLGAGWLK